MNTPTTFLVYIALLLFACVGPQPQARSEFISNVTNQCSIAGRSKTIFGVYACTSCHTGAAGYESGAGLTTKGKAYLAGNNILNVFCPDTTLQPPAPPKKGAPVLGSIDTPLKIGNTEALTLTFTATDHEGNPLKLTASGLPKGATLTPNGQSGEIWSATINWQPGNTQKNRTYTIKLIAKETGTRPALQSSKRVRLVVGDGYSNNPAQPQPTASQTPSPQMHPVGNTTWLLSESSGHPNAYRQNRNRCTSCHGANLRGTSASKAATTHNYRLEEHTIQIPAGSVVGCWTCHAGPSGGDGDDDNKNHDHEDKDDD